MTVDKLIERDEITDDNSDEITDESYKEDDIKKPSFILSVVWIVLTFIMILYCVFTLVTGAVFRLDYIHVAVFIILSYSSIIIADNLE